jgi:quinol monooxygenase YgiN
MHTLTAILRAKPGHQDTVLAALLSCGAWVRANEPGTASFFVTRAESDPCVFVTHERFTDRAAMDSHNAGEGSKGFFAAAGHLLDGTPIVVTGAEAFAR